MTGIGYAVSALDESDCRRLLSSAPAGRVGFTSGALPQILPVHCLMRDNEIVVANMHGPEVFDPGTGDVVAFEVDCCDPATRARGASTWSGPAG